MSNEADEEQLQHESDSDSDSDTNTDLDSDDELNNRSSTNRYPYEQQQQQPPGEYEALFGDDEQFENVKKFARVYQSPRYKRALEEEENNIEYEEDKFNFPKDRENWREEDLRELWADAPFDTDKPGWDPVWADEQDWRAVAEELKEGNDPPIAPFYVPYRKGYPVIPNNHHDISSPKSVIEELDRTEEFMRWVSYIFPDGSSYEGTVWDDLAHGKGVYVAEQGLVRYEGEWLQNNMEGHGVVEVEIPDIEPLPGSKLEADMRAEGKIIKRDFMNQEDREWLEKDIEDTVHFANGTYEVPFYENNEWIRQFGKKPEKGRYRYAGQWKHGRMHGCGVYEMNERPIYGRFYFGERVEESAGCDENISMMHAGIAEVAAAKARMFVNKPDGMVREERGPYSDPQHPYFYEEEDVWQAPGFINQFYEVPDYWKTYVHEVDEEREMWLNSFYKAPLRLPMPAELEYWWETDRAPEFVLLNKEPEPDPNDPSKLIYTEDPVIVHTPTGRIINYIEDEEHGVRLFWQPVPRDGEDVDPTKVKFLPLGMDEFYGRETDVKNEGIWKRLVCSIENSCKPWFEKLEQWTEEQKKASEIRKKLLEQELELAEAELSLEEALEDMEEALKQQEKEAEKKIDMDLEEEDVSVSSSLPAEQEEKTSPKEEIEDEDEEEEEEDDDLAPSSFGSVVDSKDKKSGSGRSPFSTLSLASTGFLSMVPSVVEKSFAMWKKERSPQKAPQASCSSNTGCIEYSHLVSFPQAFPDKMSLRAKGQAVLRLQVKRGRKLFGASRTSSSQSTCSENPLKEDISQVLHWFAAPPQSNLDRILSLHIPVQCLDSCSG
ncbi:protein TIC 100 [Beta vulgaris subsp. vulgaris]|uniref:protein TIC 100 n=1 Tax=Beta vulgaris subsp. vulgaris TaxID=3555 RepID=UPI0020371396|nr:protein TIC 100 [Beta vulgaris subsp. vulgaris]